MNDNLLVIKIADICVGIKPLNKGLEEFFEDYLVNEKPHFVLEATEANLDEERKRAADHIHGVDYSELELEKLWLYRQIAETIPAYDAFLMHATAVRVDNDAYLFIGPSGTGKSTHGVLWKRYFKDRMTTINDDKPLVQIVDDQIIVCGSPWHGKEGWHNNISAPLKAIVRLYQASDNTIRPMEESEAWEQLMNQTYRSSNSLNMQKTVAFIDKIINTTPLFSLNCNNDIEAVVVAYEAMGQ